MESTRFRAFFTFKSRANNVMRTISSCVPLSAQKKQLRENEKGDGGD